MYGASYAYGYWHATTHATFDVQLSYRTETGAVNRMRNGQLEFLDSEDHVLARASIDTRQNVVWLAHPDHGQCGPGLKGDDYRHCIRSQVEWVPQWASRVRRANVTLERCSSAHRHVNIERRRDGLAFWWLPLSRAGGAPHRLPYTRYRATIAVDTRAC